MTSHDDASPIKVGEGLPIEKFRPPLSCRGRPDWIMNVYACIDMFWWLHGVDQYHTKYLDRQGSIDVGGMVL